MLSSAILTYTLAEFKYAVHEYFNNTNYQLVLYKYDLDFIHGLNKTDQKRLA